MTDHAISILQAGGPHASKIGHLFWYMVSIETLIGAIVLGILFYALFRRPKAGPNEPMAEPDPKTERRLLIAVGSAITATVLILTSFVAVSYAVDRQLIYLDKDAEVEIEITGHQWWWQVRYLDKDPSKIFTTANEVHVPTGAKIHFIMKTSDVIHSMWFPNLAGKRDIIPGRDQDLYFRADEDGVWHGRCAEFCGLQHAFMGIAVYAEPRGQYDQWRAHQLEPATEPTTAEEIRGREIFKSTSCTMCHAIHARDQAAYSDNAPDLTHLKSRAMIGAEAVDNNKGNLGGWIIDPHGLKPGVHMPTILQKPRDFQALLTYLETLK